MTGRRSAEAQNLSHSIAECGHPLDRRRQLSATEWRLLAALYRRHGRVVPDVELTRAACILAYALHEHIRRLRKLLFGSRFRLETHRGDGYELVAQEDPRGS
jgi:DNA-binding response OmpR family regulator